jgi:hypothetical protein
MPVSKEIEQPMSNFWQEKWNFSLHHCGSLIASYPIGTTSVMERGRKHPECEADYYLHPVQRLRMHRTVLDL